MPGGYQIGSAPLVGVSCKILSDDGGIREPVRTNDNTESEPDSCFVGVDARIQHRTPNKIVCVEERKLSNVRQIAFSEPLVHSLHHSSDEERSTSLGPPCGSARCDQVAREEVEVCPVGLFFELSSFVQGECALHEESMVGDYGAESPPLIEGHVGILAKAFSVRPQRIRIEVEPVHIPKPGSDLLTARRA